MRRVNDILRHAAFFLNILLLFILGVENNIDNLSKWMQVAGRLHPMILHFPIVLWIVALAFEWMGKRGKQDEDWNEKIEFLLSFTALSAAAAAVFGMLLFISGAYEEGNSLSWHKWLGTITSILALSLVWFRRLNKTVYQVVLIAGVVIITVGGHIGAGITHGEDFLVAPLKPEREPIADINKALAFRDVIQPIFEEKCTGCHNPGKAKGGLQLTSIEKINKGGENGIVVVPGSPDSSKLYQYLLLPLTDDNHMPPEGKPQTDEEEKKLIHWWIQNGADDKQNIAILQTPDSIRKIIQRKYGQQSPLDNLNITYADPETIKSLNNPSRTVRQLSRDRPYIDVFMGSRKEISDKEWEELKAINNQVTSIDCSHSELNDQQSRHLVNFPHLRQFHAQHTNLTNQVAEVLKKLKYLEYVNLSGTSVTSAILTELSDASSLKKLYLYETNISANDIKQFSEKRKDIKVIGTPDISKDTSFSARLSEPIVKVDSILFRKYASVEMNFRLKGVSLYYTTNGKIPDEKSFLYQEPLMIDSTCELKVIAMKAGWKHSSVVTVSLFRSQIMPVAARLLTTPDKRFVGKNDTTLIDFEKGSTSHGDGKYLGFEGNDLDILLDLGVTKKISAISLGFLVNHGSYLLPPASVEIYGGTETGSNLKKLSILQYRDTAFIPGAVQRASTHYLKKLDLKYIRIKAKNAGRLPVWHSAKGSKSWLFVDEITIN